LPDSGPDMKPPLATGKLPSDVLKKLLRYTSRSPLIKVGAGLGEDAAVASGAQTIVLTADPVTFTEVRLGAYVVAVNANDIVAMGGTPVYLTTTVLLAQGTTEEDLDGIFCDIANACGKNGLLWVGGHTEVTSAVTRTVVCGQAVGFLSGPPLSTAGARPGDSLCMTKWAGLEGSTVIARERPEVSREVLGSERHQAVLAWLDEPGISIVAEGRLLQGLALTSGHDPTEGGVAMGIQEICTASGVGALIREDALCVRDETRLICERYRMDPLGLLSSGVFLFTAAPAVADEACRNVQSAGIPAAVIGGITEARDGVWLETAGARKRLRFSEQDEIVKLNRISPPRSSHR
jgi:hydrogenase expression/formation protein HypE